MLDGMSNRNRFAVGCLTVVAAGVFGLWFVGNRAMVDAQNADLRAATARVANIQAKLPDVRDQAAAPPVDNRVAAEPEPVDTKIWVILRDNDKNSVAAEDRWIGKPVRLRGSVYEIRPLGDSKAFVYISSEDNTLQYTATCEVRRGDAALLKVGDDVKISGYVGSIRRNHIIMDRCRFE